MPEGSEGRISSTLKAISPPWLTRIEWWKILGAFGDVLDLLLNRTVGGVRARFPGDPNGIVADQLPSIMSDALPVIGRERRIVRGPNEPAQTYARRLVRWWMDHRTRGGPYALLGQLRAFWSAAPRRIDLVYARGDRYILDIDGEITRDTVTSNADPARWSRAILVFYLDEGELPVSYSLASSIMAVPREWSAAHVGDIRVFGLAGGCRLWGYPPASEWGSIPLEPWGCAVDIGSLYPDGPPDVDYLTIDGDRLVIDDDFLVVIE